MGDTTVGNQGGAATIGTISGSIGESGGSYSVTLAPSDNGTLRLAGSNTYTGTTSISGGTLNLANADAVFASTVVPATNRLTFAPGIGTFNFGGISAAGTCCLTTPAASG